MNDIKKFEEKINRKDLIYKAGKYEYYFRLYKRKDLLVKVFILVKLI